MCCGSMSWFCNLVRAELLCAPCREMAVILLPTSQTEQPRMRACSRLENRDKVGRQKGLTGSLRAVGITDAL